MLEGGGYGHHLVSEQCSQQRLHDWQSTGCSVVWVTDVSRRGSSEEVNMQAMEGQGWKSWLWWTWLMRVMVRSPGWEGYWKLRLSWYDFQESDMWGDAEAGCYRKWSSPWAREVYVGWSRPLVLCCNNSKCPGPGRRAHGKWGIYPELPLTRLRVRTGL